MGINTYTKNKLGTASFLQSIFYSEKDGLEAISSYINIIIIIRRRRIDILTFNISIIYTLELY